MSWLHPPRFNMNQRKSKSLADCAWEGNYCDCYTPEPEDGSEYEIYERNGELKKSLPLTYRPVYGKTHPGAKGTFVQGDCLRTQGVLIKDPCQN